jgi:NAD-dependent deacetylase
MENIVVITGAGISVESGIQPFRGPKGVWEENPMEMATYHKFSTDPSSFLQWYYHRFVSCKDALPNEAHNILANKNIKVITQNIDNLHVKAGHLSENLIQIHGNINYKRKINAEYLNELVLADWQNVRAESIENDLFDLFGISAGGKINDQASYRPHILLFDEFYTELYQYEKAIIWLLEADTIIFMGTSNSVGFTSGALQIGVSKGKKVIVVDPNPSPSFNHPGVEIVKATATDYCNKYL